MYSILTFIFFIIIPKCQIFLLIMIKQDVKINLSLYINVNDYYVQQIIRLRGGNRRWSVY